MQSIFRVRYGPYDLPTTVIDSLEEYPICDCGKICPPIEIIHRTCLVQLRTANCITSTSRLSLIFGDSVYCSAHCRYLYQKST